MATLGGAYQASLVDYDGEVSSMRFAVTPLTAENWATQSTLRGDFNSALQSIILGVRAREKYGNEVVSSLERAASDAAQRELKWLVSYHDGTTLKRYSFEIGTADTSVLDPNDRPHAAIGDAGVVDAFIAALEAYGVTPDGNAMIVDEITLVGRPI